ncbi:MAG: hypothetical protein QM817_41665 [Archangium sp.]
MRSTLAAVFLALSTTALAQTPETSQQQVVEAGPRPKFGIVATTGLEAVLPVESGESVHFSMRAGLGLRFALAKFDDDAMSTLPALSFAGGLSAQTTRGGTFVASGFVETRIELAVIANKDRPLLQPAALAYLIGGFTLREGTIVPHFGIGVGWGVLFLWSTNASSSFFRGWGRIDGAGAAAIVFAAAVAAAGRFEIRYVPATGALPGATSVLIGFGF